MPWKVRNQYTLIDPKTNKAAPQVTFLPDDHPWVEGQQHKLDPCSQEEVEKAKVRAAELLTNAELQSIDGLDRDALLTLYKEYVGEPADNVTMPQLQRGLKEAYLELRETETSEPSDGPDRKVDDPELEVNESVPPKRSDKDPDSVPPKKSDKVSVKPKKGEVVL